MDERNLELIADGRTATVVAGAIKVFVDDKIRENVTLLTAIYRNGKIDHDQLVGKVAEITALLDLMSDLESVALRGDVAAAREFKDAKTD